MRVSTVLQGRRMRPVGSVALFMWADEKRPAAYTGPDRIVPSACRARPFDGASKKTSDGREVPGHPTEKHRPDLKAKAEA